MYCCCNIQSLQYMLCFSEASNYLRFRRTSRAFNKSSGVSIPIVSCRVIKHTYQYVYKRYDLVTIPYIVFPGYKELSNG